MMFHEYILQTDLLFSPTTFYLVIAFRSALQLQLWPKNNMALLWESSRQAKKKKSCSWVWSNVFLTIVGSILFACCYNMLQHSTRFFRYVKWDDPSKYTMMELLKIVRWNYPTGHITPSFDLIWCMAVWTDFTFPQQWTSLQGSCSWGSTHFSPF